MAKRAAWRGHEGSSAERGYGYAWRKAREAVMARDCGLCQVCAKAGRVTLATEVDHIVPKAEQGTDEDCNLQAICKACHAAKTEAESLRARGLTAGLRVAIGLDGWPVPQ